MRPAIVYLAQNSARDEQYGRDSRTLLERSLDLLFENYNNQFKQDVLIFHEGDFSLTDQTEIIKGRTEITFHQLQFAIPEFLPKDEVPEVWTSGDGNRYGMGHRHMIRFYAVQLFDILPNLGYDWFFRMDDDSFIHSKIDYDLFAFMEQNGYEYGYRVDIKEGSSVARGFGEAVWAYLKAENIKPTFFDEHLDQTSLKIQTKTLIKLFLMKLSSRRQYNLPPVTEYDLWGYYNNFFITRIAFWKQPKVQAFIRHFDRIGGWYKYRWNDLIFQSAAVQIFMPKEKVYKFTDWTYEHATVKQGRLFWGGFYQGLKDPNVSARDDFVRAFGQTHEPLGWSF